MFFGNKHQEGNTLRRRCLLNLYTNIYTDYTYYNCYTFYLLQHQHNSNMYRRQNYKRNFLARLDMCRQLSRNNLCCIHSQSPSDFPDSKKYEVMHNLYTSHRSGRKTRRYRNNLQ
jgi:hypothetical protein